jgi:hypothetical protein
VNDSRSGERLSGVLLLLLLLLLHTVTSALDVTLVSTADADEASVEVEVDDVDGSAPAFAPLVHLFVLSDIDFCATGNGHNDAFRKNNLSNFVSCYVNRCRCVVTLGDALSSAATLERCFCNCVRIPSQSQHQERDRSFDRFGKAYDDDDKRQHNTNSATIR